MSYSIEQTQLTELTEIIEDAVGYFCDENMISGELAWICVQALATAKQAQLEGLVE